MLLMINRSGQLSADNLKPKSGFTLVELLIGIGVTVIIVFVMAAVTEDTFIALNREQERLSLLDETRRAADAASDAILAATAILPTYVSTEPATYTTDEDTVILSLPAEDNNSTLLQGLTDVIILSREATAPETFTIRTFPAIGSRRVAGTRTPTRRLTDLTIRYFKADSDGDNADEPIDDPLLYATASRVEVSISTQKILPHETLSERLVGGGRLRNTP